MPPGWKGWKRARKIKPKEKRRYNTKSQFEEKVVAFAAQSLEELKAIRLGIENLGI
jgi:hypothetical protein